MSNGGQGKYWCFTINNATAEEEKTLSLLTEKEDFLYVCYGREIGESGTPHLQGYLELSKNYRRAKLSKLIPRAWLGTRKGTSDEAYTYCKKDGDFVEWGERSIPKQGARSDLLSIKRQLDEGASIKDIAISDESFSTWIRSHKAFDRYVCLRAPTRNWATIVYVLSGPTGVGKSRLAHYFGGVNLYTLADNSFKWFDGYTGQENVLIDDFTGKDASISMMLRLLDRYPMQVPVKCSFVQWAPRRIFITTNVLPETWFPSAEDTQHSAIRRRITKLWSIKQDIIFDNNGPIGNTWDILRENK